LDKFTIATSKKSVALTENVTKRKVAPGVASIFDPLGFISSSVIPYRYFYRNCGSTN
jgi:hypothetical protein